MSELFLIEAEKRETTGKSSARALRKAGKIPATIYSRGKEASTIAIDYKNTTSRYLKGRFKTQLCDIKLGGKTIKALPKEISFHPVTDNIEHIDFYSLEKNQKVDLKVPVKFINAARSSGVKKGGAVNIGSRYIEVICTLDNIPKEIVVDLTPLTIGKSVHQSDLSLPEGVEIPEKNSKLTVVAITGRSSGNDEDKEDGSTEEASKA